MIKPDLTQYFALMQYDIACVLSEQYEQANTIEQMIDLFHRWTDLSDLIPDEKVSGWLKGSANYIYAYFTNLSFESKIFQVL